MVMWLKAAGIINWERACNCYVELVIAMLNVNEQCLIYTKKLKKVILKKHIFFI